MGVIKSFIGSKVYYRPQGFLDKTNAFSMITSNDIKNFEKKKIKYVSIDFSKIISVNVNAIKFLNDMSEILYKKDIECCFFNMSENIYNLLLKFDNRFFNIYESEEVEKLFTSDETIQKDVYLYNMKNDENKDLIIYNLVKRGYSPIIINDENEIQDKDNSIIIKRSIILKFSDKVSAIVKNNIVYFYFDGFLDANLEQKFDISYFKRSLSIGFRIFVFDMTNVKGLNIHAISFLSKLGVESAEYGALTSIVGLNVKNIQSKMLTDLEDVGFLFFEDEDKFINSEILQEAKKQMNIICKKQKKITKDLVNLLPYFINSTIDTIELMTGIVSKKEKPEFTKIELNIDNERFVASGLAFYGDVDGMVILIFSEELIKKISEILLGEIAKTKEELYDIVSEFADIIVGNTKTKFAKYDVEIHMTLPKVFDEIDNLKTLVAEKKAIEVKFYFNDEEFYFYLTR